MKRLIITNLILLIALHILPNQKLINTPEEVKIEENIVEEIQQLEPIITEEITSRGMIESRQEIIKPTKYTNELVEFVKQKEGFSSTAYKNSGEQYLTIGYGHYGQDVYSGQTVSKETAERLLIADLDGACDFVIKYCEYLNLNQSQLDALTSFTFNCGPGNLQKLTARKTRNMNEIIEHITAYTNGGCKGLVNRRQAEKEMLLKEGI